MDGEKQIKFMTYNVWSREDVVVYERMKVIGDLVREHSPDVIFFQEITPYIHLIFESFAWWKDYHALLTSATGRTNGEPSILPDAEQASNGELRVLEVRHFADRQVLPIEADITPGSMKPIRIATTQLECPVPPASMHLRDRYMQAKQSVSALSSGDNVVFGGDMSWDDKSDLPFPLPAGWSDAWETLKCGTGGDSWTYSSFWVEKAREFHAYKFPDYFHKRSDRFVCSSGEVILIFIV